MDAADLKVFKAVLRLGGMGRPQPSEAQPNVTGHSHRLEKVLGAPLLRRHPRSVVPNVGQTAVATLRPWHHAAAGGRPSGRAR
jgi:DNA-binding transcriptional LysR family regulator